MKYDRIIPVYRALMYLRTLALPAKQARAIFGIKQALEADYTFYGEEERRLVERYAAKDKDGQPRVEGSRVFFASNKDREEYDAGISALRDMELQAQFSSMALPLDALGEQTISAEVIEDLRGVVDID
jgi:hypothetical protein